MIRVRVIIYFLIFAADTFLFAAEVHGTILQSKVVDAETNESLEGTVVVVVWTRRVFSLCMDSCSTFHDATETVADAQGNFTLDISTRWLANDRKITIYRPGYFSPNYDEYPWLFSDRDPPPNKNHVIRLRKAPSLSAQSKGYTNSVRVCSPTESDRFCVPASKVERYIQLLELVARIPNPSFFSEQSVRLPELHAATVAANFDKVRSLLDQGANPDEPDQYGRTSLMLITRIIFSNRTNVRAWAERHRGPPEMRNGAAQTFRDVSARSEAIFRALLAAGANPNAKAKNGDTALMLAIPSQRIILGTRGSRYPDVDLMRAQSPDLVNELLANGANPNVQNSDGVTALMFAAARGLGKIVDTLLTHGASVDLKANFGLTAYHLAEGDEVIKAIRTARQSSSRTPR